MFRIEVIDTSHPMYQKEVELRNLILRIPIGMSIANDELSDEVNQLHFVAIQDEELVGVVVLKLEGNKGTLRQMAVRTEFQGKEIGKKLVSALEAHAKSIGLNEIELHARHYAVGFYEKLKYSKTTRPPFEEVGMEHFEMTKNL